jgi:hypothetical protein
MNLGLTEIILIFFVLAIPLLLAAVVIFVFMKSSQKAAGNLKKCPFCAGMIPSEAIVCRFCGRDLP